jgi:hypothetical protein
MEPDGYRELRPLIDSGSGAVSVASNSGYSMFPYLPARCEEP